jgi:alpha-N-arabinofuranosidase
VRATAVNPVLPGFHPDPSICRVGDDFYVVTSTFEYFPGLPIHTSRDLAHWSLVGHVLDRPSQLPLEGVRASGGLFAPTIRWHDGLFYVVCTLVDGQRERGNFVVTAADAAGPWSEPTWLGAEESFDPSLLFEGDAAWFCATRPRRAGGKEGQTEVWVQRFDPATLSLVGEQHVIWYGAMVDVVWAEAPHLYAVEDGYLLVVAEGGTAIHHSATVARSENVLGPYENCRHNPVLTHRHLGAGSAVTSVGHADLVQAADGSWWAVCLAIRPRADEEGRTYGNLGRETFLAEVTWEAGWPIVNAGWGLLRVQQPALEEAPAAARATRDDFDGATLSLEWRYVRVPGPAVARLDRRRGHLALALTPPTLGEAASPAFIGRPQDAWRFTARTVLDVELVGEHESAGIALRQNDDFSLQLLVSQGADGRRTVRAITRRAGVDHVDGEVVLSDGPVQLTVEGRDLDYRFLANGREVAVLDGRVLSTDVAGGFTGVMLGPYATSNGQPSTTWAYFDWFDYDPVTV